MCLAIFKPAQKQFNLKHIETAWENNPHGAGLAIRSKNSVLIYKGFMALSDLLDFLKENEAYFLQHDTVLHLRWSTSGRIIPELTHPFAVETSNKKLMALECETDKAVIHNGVMFDPMTKAYSDTAIFTRLLAHKNLTDGQILKIIKNDRLAIVTKNKVKLMGDWQAIDGLFYSNTYSIEPKRNYFGSEYFGRDTHYMFECPICGSEDVEHIGVNSSAHECLKCSAIFNEKDYFIDDAALLDDLNKKDDPYYMLSGLDSLEDDDYKYLQKTSGKKQRWG